MTKRTNIFKLLKMLMMAGLVVFMLAACSSDDQTATGRGPLGETNPESSTLASDYTKCWQTEIVDILYNLMGKVALDTYRKMTGGALALMMVAFALWMAIRLLKQLSSLKEESLGEVWTEILKMFFLCFICGLVASKVDLLVMVLGDVIFPIYNAFLEFASTILAGSTVNQSATVSVFGVSFTTAAPTVCSATAIKITGDMTGFPDSPKQMMDCMICSMNNSLAFGMTIAFDIMKRTQFISWLIGLLLLACFLFVRLAFVFYLVDTIFRFTVMVVMLPLMIIFYPFKQSRGILGKGIANMINSAAFMLFFAVIITMCVQALTVVLKSFGNVFTSDASLTEFSVPFICMMMIGFLVVSTIQIAGKLCDSIVGGKSNSAFQQSVKALVVGAVKLAMTGGCKALVGLFPNSKLAAKINDKNDAWQKHTGALKGGD